MGTLIRHARPTATVFPLAVPMVKPSFYATLVAEVGAAALPAPGFVSAGGTAVALSAIAVPADPEHCMAPQTRSLTKDRLAMKIHCAPTRGAGQRRTIMAG